MKCHNNAIYESFRKLNTTCNYYFRFGFKIVAPNSGNTNELLITNTISTTHSNTSANTPNNNNSTKATTILSNVILQVPRPWRPTSVVYWCNNPKPRRRWWASLATKLTVNSNNFSVNTFITTISSNKMLSATKRPTFIIRNLFCQCQLMVKHKIMKFTNFDPLKILKIKIILETTTGESSQQIYGKHFCCS